MREHVIKNNTKSSRARRFEGWRRDGYDLVSSPHLGMLKSRGDIKLQETLGGKYRQNNSDLLLSPAPDSTPCRRKCRCCSSLSGSRHTEAGLLQLVSGRSPAVVTRPPAACAERSGSADFPA